jgi:hypothetical protein
MTDMRCDTCECFELFDEDYEVWSAGRCKKTDQILTIRQCEEWRCCWREKKL